MTEWILAIGIAAMGVAGLTMTIVWPFDRRRRSRKPRSFGSLHPMPSGSLDRGDCA